MKKELFYMLAAIVLISSCRFQNAYYQSPLHTNTAGYKTVPLKSEHTKTATFASGAITTGGANQLLHDGFSALQGAVHRSHNIGFIQCYYGITGSAGWYRVRDYRAPTEEHSYNFNSNLLNSVSGNKFFTTAGAVGSVNIVLPLGKEDEWRILGVEYSWNKEFGKYLEFRKKVPDEAVNLVDRDGTYTTLSFFSEITGLIDKDVSIGYKIALVRSLEKLSKRYSSGPDAPHTYGYFSQTLHVSNKKLTGFGQLNLGTYGLGFQLGMNYRIWH